MMQIRRNARHETVASARHALTEQQYWEYQPGARVMTVDGPGRVEAVHSGPFAGAEDYQIALEGGLGGGTYSTGQITALLSSQAAGEHTAAEDYPELGTVLQDRPDPASLTYTAARTITPLGWEGTQGPFPSEYGLPHIYARDIHSGAGNCVCGDGLYGNLHIAPAPGVEFAHTADLVGQGDPGSSQTPQATEEGENGAWPPEYNNTLYHRKDDIPKVVAHIRKMDDPGDDPEALRDHLVHAHGVPGDIMGDYELQDYKDEHEEQHRPEWDNGIKPWHPHEHAKGLKYEKIDEDVLPAAWWPGTGGRTEDSPDVLYKSKPYRLTNDQQRSIFDPWHMSSKNASLEMLGWELAENEGLDVEPESGISMPVHNTASLSSLPAFDAHLVMGPKPTDDKSLRDHLVSQHGYTNDQLANLTDPGQGDALEMEHELEHDASTYEDGIGGGEFGAGESGVGAEHSHKGGPEADLFPEDMRHVPVAAPNGIISLNHLIMTAAVDPEFRFHVQASWADVRAKAKRIRSEGKVSITHADDLMVIGMVEGDHHTYETGLQRVPGRRQSVASYSCGCKWGAYHWGASDDLSRFAGRMCSHALALQFEAASRGMFGRDVEVDKAPARWVPSKVVVKYDIDDGENIYAHASKQPVPEQSPWIVIQHLGGTNELFGGGLVEAPAGHQNIIGPTVPRNPEENPASSGFLSNPDPKNWGSITENGLDRYSSLDDSDEGAEATLHDEPEGALPATDGSLGDVDATERTPDEDDLEPESPSIMTQGNMSDVNLMPGSGIGGIEGTDMEDGADDPVDVASRRASLGTPDVGDIVADFQRSAAAKSLMSGSGKPSAPRGGDFDFVEAANLHLAKVAAQFSAGERSALIHESPGTQAANTDRLDIEGTHYAEIQAQMEAEGDDSWLA